MDVRHHAGLHARAAEAPAVLPALLRPVDTTTSVQGVNGVAGHGGSIDAASITAANGLLLVNSGYGMFGETPGNVILAFRAKGNKAPS